MSEGTIKERLTRIETLLENHLEHHRRRDKWMLSIMGTLVAGMALMAIPGFVRWLGTIF